jgi:FlaA1/EpsC-like NDP-sugar epimerase
VTHTNDNALGARQVRPNGKPAAATATPPAPAAGTRKVLSFANALPPARSKRDRLLRRQLESKQADLSTRAALELASAYVAIAPSAARGLLRRAASGPPVTAARALLRLVYLAVEAGGGEQRDAIGEYLDEAQEVTSLPAEDPLASDPELLAVRIDIATALAFADSIEAALRILLNIESVLRQVDDHDRLGAPQQEPFRRLAALTSLRLGEMQTESNPHAADGHLERAVMLGTGSLQAVAALRRGTLLEHHAGGLGPEIERQYMLAIDLEDPYASPLAGLAMGDILWKSERQEKARDLWEQAKILGDAQVLERAERRLRGDWQREKHPSERDRVDERLNYARPLQDVRPPTELGRVASGRAPDSPMDDEPKRPVLVVGAGTGGHYLLPALTHSYDVVGFLDDDPAIDSVGDIKVLGTTAELGRILREHKHVAQVIFAIPTAPGTTRLRVLRAANRHGVDVVALPPMFELRHGHSLLAQLRPFEVHETYGDFPWDVDREVQQHVRGRRVAIVGASSLLGAEVARLIAHGQPRHLLLIDEPAVPLMSIAGEIRKLRGLMDCEARIVDYADPTQLSEALGSNDPAPEVVLYCGGVNYAPDTVLRPLHAARANVLAAATVAAAARSAGCKQLVMASADRAGHRESFFDMTKALAEIAALREARGRVGAVPTMHEAHRSVSSSGEFRVSVLRLPNLWGKDGAVVGRLIEQLRHGGPLVVRSGRKRCFAPTWDAAQTMLRLLGGDHESGLFALSGGEVVEIRELAERLLLINGLVASRDIRIVSTSRADTKASLKLWGRNESCGRESVSGALQIEQRPELEGRLKATLDELLDALKAGSSDRVERSLGPIDSVEPGEDQKVLAV